MNTGLRLYRPSNGTEGMGFMDLCCGECVHDWAFRQGESDAGCEIVARALMFGKDDKKYPREWCYDADGHPTCTAFKQRPDNDKPGTASRFAKGLKRRKRCFWST